MRGIAGGWKRIATLVVAVTAAFAGASAFAQSADDKKWINQCLSDNRDAKVAASVVSAYCTCMNGKMSDKPANAANSIVHKTYKLRCHGAQWRHPLTPGTIDPSGEEPYPPIDETRRPASS